MEEITKGVSKMEIVESLEKNRIQVYNTEKPLFFYVNLAKFTILRSPFSSTLISPRDTCSHTMRLSFQYLEWDVDTGEEAIDERLQAVAAGSSDWHQWHTL
ncbi:unnamed protein product [Fraxinus pennsylvanica]|uniref:Uncharacterized protein n=1 Tax=Fraxinus pennsylvanica TaxID=56036 RepID=A0AAD1ZWR2_9LAMI|nr:unnamed protein product [Fraxinus pennsylvanica]